MEQTPRLAGISSDSLINKKTAHTHTNKKLFGKKKKKKSLRRNGAHARDLHPTGISECLYSPQ
jgi:hypothetical protein